MRTVKKKTFNLFLSLACIIFVWSSGCSENAESKSSSEKDEDINVMCTCSPYFVYLQPYGNFTEQEAATIKTKLEEQHLKLLGYMPDIEVLPNRTLPEASYYAPKGSFRAADILDFQKVHKSDNEVVIGLTHKKINIDHLHGVDHWGIHGLSYLGKNVSIVSDFSPAIRKDFWKHVFHEYGHAFAGLPHCKDTSCIMTDAKGKSVNHTIYICDDCKNAFQKADKRMIQKFK